MPTYIRPNYAQLNILVGTIRDAASENPNAAPTLRKLFPAAFHEEWIPKPGDRFTINSQTYIRLQEPGIDQLIKVLWPTMLGLLPDGIVVGVNLLTGTLHAFNAGSKFQQLERL